MAHARAVHEPEGPGRIFIHDIAFVDTSVARINWNPHRELNTFLPTIASHKFSTYFINKVRAPFPNLQEKVYQELKAVVGDRLVTEDDIPKLVYLDACIKETLRKYPPVPILPARYIEEDVQLGGYDIPKGWEVIDS